MIVKVQVPLSDAQDPLLVYNEGQTLMRFMPQSQAREVIAAMAGRPKAYFHAELVGGVLSIGSLAPDEEW